MRLAATTLFIGLSAVAAYAAPPSEGSKLSEIIAKIEQKADTAFIDEVDWNDRGYYEIEYVTKAGAKVEVKVDPKTGENVR
ncbi:putative membrane protein YkoI [Ochrobactrum sp. RH1CCR137]|nr:MULTISPECIES: PepSY domain-containing protein [Brucella/Ochrobactrum group]MBA8844877.1 putative membrane protein YkoI [Ochrobactrum sp. RH1CCR137]MBA8855000.1 putative membrane protein YkoI [Ochrobactrum sp. RH1CCR134]